MRFIEKNKHRLIEKQTMELATSWYYRYIEKEEQIEKIEQNLIEFENWLVHQGNVSTISMAELQKAWFKTIKL
jgi:hypothetical protein